MTNSRNKPALAARHPNRRVRKVNWTKIYQLSLKSLRPIGGEVGKVNGNLLRDTRSFTMGGGRQTGKTAFAIGEVLADDVTLLICRDKDYRDEAVARYAEVYGKGGTLKGRGRILTALDIEAMKPAKLKRILRPIQRVIFDEAAYNYKLSFVYNVLANHGKLDIIAVEIR